MSDVGAELAARIDIIVEHFSTGASSDTSLPLIHEISSRVAFFPLVLQYLSSTEDFRHIIVSLQLIRSLLNRRGCLLGPEALGNGVLAPLMAYARIVPSSFFSDPAFTSQLCPSIATAYRLLFEKSEGGATLEELFEMVEDGTAHIQVLALKIMDAIVECFKSKMSHLTDGAHGALSVAFRNTTLFRYFQTACRCLEAEPRGLLYAAMELLHRCLTYDSKTTDVLEDTYQFTVPLDMIAFCMSTEVPRALFHIYHNAADDPFSARVLDILPYFSASATSQGTVAQLATPRLTYLDFIARELKDIVVDERLPKGHLLGLSRLLLKVAFLIPVVEFLGLEIAWEFFTNVHTFSCRLFGDLENPDSRIPSINMLTFWAKLARAAPGRTRDLPAPYIEFFRTVFQSFVEGILGPVPGTAAEFRQCERYEMDSFVTDVAPLWGVAAIVPQHATDIIRGLMDRFTEEIVGPAATPATAHRLAVLVLMVAARIDIRIFKPAMGPGAVAQLATLISGILALVSATDRGMEALANSLGPSLEILEAAITRFVVFFRRDYLGDSTPIIDHVYAALVPPGTRQDVFNLFVDRFLRDLKTLVQFPNLLEQILDFLHALLTKSESETARGMAASHALLQGLTRRELFLDFSAVDPAESKRLLVVLNRIYARSIKTTSGWIQFLDHFDGRFAGIAGQGYTSPYQVFCLYREIYGVLSGIGKYTDYLIVFRWFMGRHVEDTLNVIRAQARSPIIANAVARTWYLLASNKGKKLLLPPASAEGIQLFHGSLRVIGALIQCLDETDEQKYMICKIIRPSISERYANFGVMELYDDASLDEMLGIFFRILDTWEFSQICPLKKGVRIILETIEALIATRPNKLDDARLCRVAEFIHQTLNWPDDAKFDVKWGPTQNCFRLACQCLQSLMLFCLGRTGVDWGIFRPHFVAITDHLFHPVHPVADTAAGPLCYVVKMDGDFVQGVFQGVYASFDEEYRGEIQAIVERAFQVVDRVTSPDQVQKFRYVLAIFEKEIMRFSIELAEVPGLEEFFRK